jgi:rod shape-determining protein MreC
VPGTPVHWPLVARNRTARPAVLGVSVRRPDASSTASRTSASLRRRAVVGFLVVVALALITVSFKESDTGPLASAQDAAIASLRPFEVAADRVARPFRDLYRWADSLFAARSDAKVLKEENEALRQQVIQNEFAARENVRLRGLLAFKDGPSFPRDFEGLAAAVIARPSGSFAQAVVVAVGAKDGVSLNAPVVTEDGLVGLVTRVFSNASRVTLLSDQQLAVSALDVRTNAAGVVRHGRGASATLVLDRVPKEELVNVGDTVVTAGWRSDRLASLYPKGIPIGSVTSVGQADTDLYKQVQVQPFADFGALDAVLVLVPKNGEAAP